MTTQPALIPAALAYSKFRPSEGSAERHAAYRAMCDALVALPMDATVCPRALLREAADALEGWYDSPEDNGYKKCVEIATRLRAEIEEGQ